MHESILFGDIPKLMDEQSKISRLYEMSAESGQFALKAFK